MIKKGLIGLVILGFLAAAGATWWFIDRQTKPQANSETNQQPANTQAAPDFALKTPEGQEIRLSSYRGQKPVILDFWATWCPNCRRDMPVLNQLYNKYRDRLEVIAINRQESESGVKDFVTAQGFDFVIVLDPVAHVHAQYGNPYTNTHVLIDKNGVITKVIPGDISEADIVSLIGG